MKVIYKARILITIFAVVLIAAFAHGQISADFSSSNLTACNTLQTTFFDQSTSASSIIDWSWDLEVNTSLEQNPGTLFTQPGSYTICLTVTDVNGNSDTECKEDYVTVYPNPIADFTMDNTEGCIPVSVNFSDNSSSDDGAIVSWLWDVGGSVGVLDQTVAADFSSTYAFQGSYTASLTVVDIQGCSATTSLPNAVVASALVTPDIVAEVIPTCELPWMINFINLTADPLITYTWDFGNGETHTGLQPPTVTYTQLGQYDVTMYMASGDCADTIVFTKFINTESSASFTYNPSVVCQDGVVSFTDVSLSQADEVLWRFGDGSTSSDIDPTHTYEAPGCYDVTLIRIVGECIDSTTISCVEVLALPAVTYDITNQYTCTLPADVILHAESSQNGTVSWQFVDGINTQSFDQNDVVITVTEYGEYFAVLQYRSETGCITTIDSIPIVIAPLEVNMPVAGVGGCAPLTFFLADSISSNIPIASYSWSIGSPPAYNSNDAVPSFTISDTGRYDLQLIVENIYGCMDSIFLEDYIQVGLLPEVDFSATPLQGCVEDDKFFTNLSSPFTDAWQWFFGDTGYSEEQNPVYSFGEPGVYDVALYSSHNGCTDSIRFPDYITIFEPVSKFVLNYSCDDPYTVDIENRSLGADSLVWTLHLSDTEVITSQDSIFGSYTFPDRGEYPISHYSKSFVTGCEHTREDTIRIVDPIASYAVDTLRGCAPFTLQIGNFSQDAFSYEFISDVANIDSIFNEEPEVTFTEGGILHGPLLIVTDIHECRDSFQLADSIQVNKIEAIIDFPEVICVPDVAQLIGQSNNELGEIVGWEWTIDPVGFISDEQTTSLYIDSVGLYDLSFYVENDWGCTDSIDIIQAINAVEIIPDFSFDTLGCAWAPIRFRSMGDNGSVASYLWDFGDGNTSALPNPNYTYANEGIYSVCLTMADLRGCEKTICKENIVTISNPVAQFVGDPTSATCPPLLTNFENLSINATKYEWDFGDNSGRTNTVSPSHVYTSPGRFDLTLIAESTPMCRDTLLLPEYVVVEGPQGDFTADIAPTCLPVSVTLDAASDDYYNYVWDLGNGVLDSVSGLVIMDQISFEYTQPGRYTPKLIITDSIGCTRSFAGDPIEVDLVTLDFTMTQDPICGPPLAVVLENLSAGSTDEVEYRWLVTGPDDYESSDVNPSFNIQQTGQYEVSLIGEYGSCIDTLTMPDFMEVADIPLVSFEVLTEELCEDVNVSFINTSTVDYGEFVSWIWDFGDGNTSTEKSPTHQYSGLESQSITLTGITEQGCEATYTADFDVLPSTVANVEEDKVICIGDQIQINGYIDNLQPMGSFYWEDAATLSCTDCLSPVVMPTETTSYVLVGIHPNGCESRDTIEIIVIPTPGPELTLMTDSIICTGAESQIDVVNYIQDYTYEWDTSVPGQDCYNDCEVVNITPIAETTYYVTVFNEFGCFKYDSITVAVESSIDDFLTDETGICIGEEATLSVIGANNPTWDPHVDIDCSDCSDVLVSPSESTTYTVKVESDIGCIYEDSVIVIVVPAYSANAGIDEVICIGESVALSAVGYGSSVWSNSNQDVIDSTMNISVSPDISQYIYLNMTFYECEQADSVYVTVHDKADIEAVGDTICPSEIATISASGRADEYIWSVTGDENMQSEISVTPDVTTDYYVIGQYRTCEPDTSSALVYVHPKIDYNIEEDFYNIFLNNEILIAPTYDMTRAYSFDWQPAVGLNCADCPAPIISGIRESIDYNVLTVDEETGCAIDQDIQVRFNNECTNSVFYLPNIFSPNGDGQNEGWRMRTNNPEEFISISVFDRYGNLVFTSEDIQKEWDGSFVGQPVVEGVYVYRVRLICPYDRSEYQVVGDVTVIR